jgi:hypothetical protein
MIQMALSIATGLSHLHIEIIGTQVGLLLFSFKKLFRIRIQAFLVNLDRDSDPGFFISERYKKLQLQSSSNFSQASLKEFQNLGLSSGNPEKNIHLSKTFHIFFLLILCVFFA